MSDFNYQPSYGMQQISQPKVLRSTYGDGYEQRANDGLNSNLPTLELMFVRENADAFAIEDFFKLKNGVTSFTWTPSGESELRVVCERWVRVRISHGIHQISASFRKVLS